MPISKHGFQKRLLSAALFGIFCTAGLVNSTYAASNSHDAPHSHATAGAPIVESSQLESALARGAILWDVRSAEDYKRGHIPGAINFGDAGKVLRDEQKEDFLPTAVIEKIFAEAGLDPSREIIVYGGRGNAYAYFGRYAVRYFGGQQVSVFHDGIEGWREAGKPVAVEPTRLPALTLKLTPVSSLAVSTDEVAKRFNKPGVQVLDVRTRKEFSGDDIRAIRGGHIPGAVNIPYEQNWQDPDAPQKISRKESSNSSGLALKNRAALENLYKDLDRDKETIIYCQSGVRASETSTVLETLGFKNIKVYDSSWLGWAAKLSVPVEDEAFLNVGALTGEMKALKQRIADLEKQIATK